MKTTIAEVVVAVVGGFVPQTSFLCLPVVVQIETAVVEWVAALAAGTLAELDYIVVDGLPDFLQERPRTTHQSQLVIDPTLLQTNRLAVDTRLQTSPSDFYFQFYRKKKPSYPILSCSYCFSC